MSKAFDSALRLLARREHGANELAQKLAHKGFERLDIENAVDKCQQLNYQSDERFIASFCRQRIGQGYGPQRIIQELQLKGLAKDLILEIINEQNLSWETLAREVIQKKFRQIEEQDFVARQKQQRFLQNRGFSFEIINKLFK
ncbi:recombination regulator RecX [Legionella quinlivanii]|nr:recombination regulator RecX [Legionella quinlivanii]KTD53103.1 recombination regulator RecX [Legionella quinlivanii]MCW8451318.1 recombination regulator RecX [Legionella quinlivanii]SEG17586.1 regulatory protein [Legionella quinlivanii DSM 21216]STY10484.1 regulatory protein RecX [Legionella quinlivanii]